MSDTRADPEADLEPRRVMRLREALLGRRYRSRYRFTSGNEVRLFHSGEGLFGAMIERIDAARRDVALETYIFCKDATGQALSDALMRAARRGVRVRVITDGVGTARLDLFNSWPGAGIEHRIYNPHIFGRFGFSRTHRKLAVIDDQFAYCGGINVVDDMENDGKPLPFPRWDFAVELAGPVVVDVREAIEMQWRRIRLGHRPPLAGPDAPDAPDALASLSPGVPASAGFLAPHPTGHTVMQPAKAVNEVLRELSPVVRTGRAQRIVAQLRERLRAGVPDPRTAHVPCVAFVARDNVVNRRAIEKAYLDAIGEARKEVLLANPYFMPGRRLRRALVEAAARNVTVKLLIGRKEFKVLDYGTPFLYHQLLSAGVQIAEYEKTMLHGKVAVVDDVWGTVGSSNLDALSLVLNNEANVLLVQHSQIGQLRAAILSAFEESPKIDRARYEARPWHVRAVNWLAWNSYRVVMKLLTVGGYD
ncbi:cardiolipin synthase [Paraburkholderia bannensis]|uniref:Cardiolipin synthase B n=2 Tax=Burkholderiaceae TaxID=119060 RepID=A0A7W9TSR2_9BURK|nr:cardiolipin synthase [Paraburkholderia sp. WP4_3_2]MBB6100778.1 cardiolipin synthase [Paraburkholderia bannensis]